MMLLTHDWPQITLTQLERAKSMRLTDILRQDHCLATHCVATHDFAEGVKCKLITKSGKPSWSRPPISDSEALEWCTRRVPGTPELSFAGMPSIRNPHFAFSLPPSDVLAPFMVGRAGKARSIAQLERAVLAKSTATWADVLRENSRIGHSDKTLLGFWGEKRGLRAVLRAEHRARHTRRD